MTVPLALEFLPCGDTALCVQFGEVVDRDLCLRVVNLKEAVSRAALPGVVETVPTYRSLLVHYNPLQTNAEELKDALAGLVKESSGVDREVKRWLMPLCCDSEFAWDLADLSTQLQRSETEIQQILFDTELFIYMIGFTMGLLYFGDFPQFQQVSRRTSPRTKLAAGAVAVAQGSGVIYPVESPGGWNVIGNTAAPLFDVRRDPPSLFTPGDTIRFQAVGRTEHERIAEAVARGEYELQWEAGK
jgi:KipI family sensor histidine kinase inhibitor